MHSAIARPTGVDSKLKQVTYLEQALKIWHDYWFIWAISEKVSQALSQPFQPDLGQVANIYPRLQSFLLGDCGSSEFAIEDFIPPSSPAILHSRSIATLPVGLKNWCANSRRVYQLEPELQAVLEVTSLKSMQWRDVRLPFPTFGIELARPHEVDDTSVDFVLVNLTPCSENMDGHLTLWFFNREQLNYEPLTAESKRSMEQLLRDRKFQTLRHRLVNRAQKIGNHGGGFWHFSFRDDQLQEFAQEDLCPPEAQTIYKLPSKSAVTLVNKMMRIIIGLPLYLKSLPAGSSQVTALGRARQNASAQHTSKSRSITEGADIFRIAASFKLTREERVFLELEGTQEERTAVKRELCCHFREGYWRRPRGQGKNPDAEKTEKVRFTIVRRDKLKEGELPAGSSKTLA